MRVGWISHCLENSGWGRACRGYINAAATQDIDLMCLPVSFRPMEKDSIPENLADKIVAHKKDLKDIDITVFHTLPRYFEKLAVPSIGCGMYETYSRQQTLEFMQTQIMDELWVSNSQFPENLLPTYNIPFPVEEYVYSMVPSMVCDELKDTYIFYNIAELSKRKNVWAAVISYYSSFTIDDPVTLLLKLSHPKMSPEKLKKECESQLANIQEGCNIHRSKSFYPKVVIETDNWSREQILGLHDFGDCFVSTSFGEAWCYPLMDALVRGNTAISCPHEGAKELKSFAGDNLVLCEGYKDFVYDHSGIPQYNTSREHWIIPSRLDISKLMYQKFEEWKKDKKLNEFMIEKLSCKEVGYKMMERLVDVSKK